MVAYKLEDFGMPGKIDQIIMTGGAIKSDLWPQIIADICNVHVKAILMDEITAYGAAHLAARAAGIELNHFENSSNVKIYEPKNADAYRQWYQNFQKPYFLESGQ